MSPKRMDRIRNFISHLGEDEMEVDLDFTERYLSQFESIDRQTIEVLTENGYQTKEHLLAFDLHEDLPMLPVLNMAQKSLLRNALKQFHESEELEIKINDLKGDDSKSPNVSIIDTVSTAGKRKLDSISGQTSTKRMRSSPEKSNVLNDGLGTRMRQLVNKRKPIHSSNSQTDSDNDTEFLTSVDPKRFQFAKNQINGFGLNRYNSRNEEPDEDEEPEEIETKPTRRGRPRAQPSPLTQQQGRGLRGPLRGPPIPQAQDSEESEEEKPLVIETKTLRGRRSVVPTPVSRRVSGIPVTARKSIATPYSLTVKTEPKTTPKSRNSTTSSSTHIPTPTELEVRERLAQKKALAQQKSGRKRR